MSQHTSVKHDHRRGFTLVEVMIVVGIIGLLATIAIPSFMKARLDGQCVRIANDLKVFRNALQIYAIDTGSFPPIPAGGGYPPELAEYIDQTSWTDGVPGGGEYLWLYDNSLSEYVLYIDDGPRVTMMTRVDEIIDDGHLLTGMFRQGSGLDYYFIVQ